MSQCVSCLRWSPLSLCSLSPDPWLASSLCCLACPACCVALPAVCGVCLTCCVSLSVPPGPVLCPWPALPRCACASCSCPGCCVGLASPGYPCILLPGPLSRFLCPDYGCPSEGEPCIFLGVYLALSTGVSSFVRLALTHGLLLLCVAFCWCCAAATVLSRCPVTAYCHVCLTPE